MLGGKRRSRSRSKSKHAPKRREYGKMSFKTAISGKGIRNLYFKFFKMLKKDGTFDTFMDRMVKKKLKTFIKPPGKDAPSKDQDMYHMMMGMFKILEKSPLPKLEKLCREGKADAFLKEINKLSSQELSFINEFFKIRGPCKWND